MKNETDGKFAPGERALMVAFGQKRWCVVLGRAYRHEAYSTGEDRVYDVRLISTVASRIGLTTVALEEWLKKPCSQEVIDAARRRSSR